MAVSILSQFNDNVCYSSELQQVELESTTGSVEFRVYHQSEYDSSADGRTLMFSTVYNTVSSQAVAYDIGSLIEAYMLQNNYSVQQFVLYAASRNQSDEKTLTVVYCKQEPEIFVSDLLNDHFLTNSLSRLTYPTSKELLPYFGGFGNGYFTRQVTYTGVYVTEDGEIGECSATSYGRSPYGVQSLNACYEYVMNALNTRIPEGAKLVKYTVTMGKRTARFYVCEQTLNLRQFIFRNAYNCRESITFVSAQTTKTVSKSSTAVCGDVMTQYDVRHTRSFEEQTPVLQKSRALFLAEFLTSPQIFLPIDSVEHEVLITDYKHEVSDNPGEGNIIKFEWQFASLRYPLTDDEYTRFFSSQYSEPFA